MPHFLRYICSVIPSLQKWGTLCSLLLCVSVTNAQNVRSVNPYLNDALNDERKGGFSTDSIELTNVPEGIYAWHIEPRFGDITPVPYDTIPHAFQNENQTSGTKGHYSYTGNLGAPRVSRFFYEQGANMQSNPFIFKLPYDYFIKRTDEILFTNTKSPFTNLTYHSCGNKQNGEDRLKALFSVNAGKRWGMGFKADYLYGRGYYEGQSTADFDGTVFLSYRGDNYQMHAYVQHTYLKTRENGGIENDDYVNRPETFPTRYGTADMPVNLARAWNKIGGNQVYLNHRYSVGFNRYRDYKGRIVKDPNAFLAERLKWQKDSIMQRAKTDSLHTAEAGPRLPRLTGTHIDEQHKETEEIDTLKLTTEFVPVTSFIHTMKLDDNTRKFISNEQNTPDAPGYFNDFYLSDATAFDRTHHFGLENTFAIELHEGLNRWMKMGLRLYGKHELAKFDFRLPADVQLTRKTNFTENYFTLGGQLIEHHNRFFRYNLLGEVRTTGTDWGEFNVEGDITLSLPLKRDSLQLLINGFVRNERPSFYFRHFYARNAWWDNAGLDKMFHARVNATLRYKRTSLTASLENIQNYLYFQETLVPFQGSDSYETYHHSINVAQANKNTQLLALVLNQDFQWGIFHWDNELAYQTSTNKSVLPVPAFNLYSNLYLKFRIAKVLLTEFGADVRYFTRYKAPTYSPIIGQYAVQDANYSTSVGNYPIVSAYVNFHLKRTRFYLMASHLNYSSGAGNPFLIPHYPLNRMTIHFGISWNFVN